MGFVVIYSLCWAAFSERKEVVSKQFVKGGRNQSKEVETPQMVNT